jgi:hypothetical protein
MREEQVFQQRGIQYCVAVKTSSLVPNRDCDFSVYVATARNVNALARVIAIAVDHGIRQGFMQGHLDVDLASIARRK